MSNHPPIPPSLIGNCEPGKFNLYNEGVGYRYFWPDGTFTWLYAAENKAPEAGLKLWLMIIATIARAGWLDESRRINDLQSPCSYEECEAALENAEKWVQWAKGLNHE